MFYIFLVILLNTYIFTAFKLFAKYQVNSLQAISVNYWVCVVTGYIFDGYQPFATGTIHQSWFTPALVLGVYFIFLFNLLSYSTAKQGMTATTIANKLSLVIPVVISWWLYHDTMNLLKIAGIAIAIPAVYMATKKTGEELNTKLLLPFLIFICSGVLDAALKYAQHYYLPDDDMQPQFTITLFAVAAVTGTAYAIVRIWAGKDKWNNKNILAGILLGIPNYFSILFLIRLFDSGVMQSSAIIPVNNIGIMVCTTLVAIFAFKETTNRQRIAGVVLSIISILLIAASEL